jgi:hypothetical protein
VILIGDGRRKFPAIFEVLTRGIFGGKVQRYEFNNGKILNSVSNGDNFNSDIVAIIAKCLSIQNTNLHFHFQFQPNPDGQLLHLAMTMTMPICLNLVVLALSYLSFSSVEAFTARGGASSNHRGNYASLPSLKSASARWWSKALATTTTLRMSDFDFPSAMPIKPELTMMEKLEESVGLICRGSRSSAFVLLLMNILLPLMHYRQPILLPIYPHD